MFKFINSFRAALLLGKAHKQFENRRFGEALERALRAQRLPLTEQFEWLSYSIEGKSRCHLGDFENALPALRRAESALQPILESKPESKHLHNIMNDIRAYIEKIESAGDDNPND